MLDRDAVEREMREEMEFHLQQEALELGRDGTPPEAARRAATLAFGGVEGHKEAARDSRGGRWLEDLRGDLGYMRRQLMRAPMATVGIVGILGLGAAGAGLVFAVMHAYLLRPLPVPQADRLAYVLPGPQRDAFSMIPDLSKVDWNAAAKEFEGTAAWDLDGFTLVGGAAPEYIDGAWVSEGYFDLLGANVIRGRRFRAEEFRPGNRVAIISADVWRRRFNSADSVVGLALKLYSTDRPDEQELVTIVGVLAPQAWRVNRFQDLLRPLGEPRMFSLARVPSGKTFDVTAARLTTTIRATIPVSDTAWRMSLVSALDEHVYRLRPMLQVLTGVAALLLLLSTASVGALLVARGDERTQELTIRRALGATAQRLTRQVVAEIGATWVLAAGLGLALTSWFARDVASGVESMGGISVPAGLGSVGLDTATVGFVLAASAVPLMLLGLVPVLCMVRETATAARPDSRVAGSRASAGARRALVVVQVALSVALLINATLLLKTVRSIENAPLGFDSTNLLKGHLLLPRTRYPDALAQLRAADALITRVGDAPGVAEATIVNPHPFRGTVWRPIECEGCDAASDAALRATPQTIAPNYFHTLSIPLVGGRGFGAQDVAGAPPVAIISASLAARWGGVQSAIGRRVRLRSDNNDGTWHTVVGVTGDVRKTFGDTLLPDLYIPLAQNPRAYFAMLVRTHGAAATRAGAIRHAIASVDEALPLADVESMEDVLRARSGGQRFLAGFAVGAATLALVLTGCALYAVIAYLTMRRRREFAVRLALGAPAASIAGLVMREGGRLLLGGVIAGLAVASMGGLLVRSFLFGVMAFDLTSYVVSVLVVATLAGAALAVPALRASRRPPALVLRDEA